MEPPSKKSRTSSSSSSNSSSSTVVTVPRRPNLYIPPEILQNISEFTDVSDLMHASADLYRDKETYKRLRIYNLDYRHTSKYLWQNHEFGYHAMYTDDKPYHHAIDLPLDRVVLKQKIFTLRHSIADKLYFEYPADPPKLHEARVRGYIKEDPDGILERTMVVDSNDIDDDPMYALLRNPKNVFIYNPGNPPYNPRDHGYESESDE